MSLATRLLAAAIALVLLVSVAVALSRAVAAPPSGPEAGRGGAIASASPTPAVELPVEPAAAEALGGATLLAAATAAAQGPWRSLGHPAWPVVERPVYVARAELSPDRRRVAADVTIGLRAPDEPELVLRLLPAAAALGDSGLAVDVRVGGAGVDARVDRDGARLFVPLGAAAGTATVVRVRLSYDVPARSDIRDDGGPAGFGLLAWNPDSTLLGHWLPLLTTDAGPMVPWGDVGAFPPAVWSLVIVSGGTVVTGGEESDCPPEVETGDVGCTWSRGVALRDDPAVAYDATVDATERVGDLTVNAVAARATEREPDLAGMLAAAAASAELLIDRLGPLAWGELDVAFVPLSAGAAGMEFPGLVAIDSEEPVASTMDGGWGEIVVAHEVAHQWFHALVGNSSLADPVIDESLAQYLTYVHLDAVYGAETAAAATDALFVARYEAARQLGLVDEPPAQPLAGFEGADAYGPLVYARAPMGWVVAEREVGREPVVALLAALVERYGLDEVTVEELLALAEQRSPEIAAILRRYWLDPEPIALR